MISPNHQFVTAATSVPDFLASCDLARFSSSWSLQKSDLWNFRRIIHGDEAIGIAWISHHQDSDIFSCIFLNSLALPNEDLPLIPSRSLRSIPAFARYAAYEQSPVHVAKAFLKAGGWDYRL
jgi:hypothetical protein